MMSGGIVREECDTAEVFLNRLHPRNNRWQTVGGWIYRGHADAEWKLLPKALRSKAWEGFCYGGFDPSKVDEWVRVKTEQQVLRDSGASLDRLGVPLPEGAHAVLAKLDQWLKGGVHLAQWMEDCIALAALAQHHGLPTRLLDFTDYGYVAAYFAAQELTPTPNEAPPDTLCVWAFNLEFLETLPEAEGRKCQIGRVARAHNPNLHAQSGLFVTWTGEKIAPLEDLVTSASREGDPAVVARCLTLPRTEAPELLQLLMYERITGASMFPGPDGVVRSMKEKVRWERDANGWLWAPPDVDFATRAAVGPEGRTKD